MTNEEIQQKAYEVYPLDLDRHFIIEGEPYDNNKEKREAYIKGLTDSKPFLPSNPDESINPFDTKLFQDGVKEGLRLAKESDGEPTGPELNITPLTTLGEVKSFVAASILNEKTKKIIILEDNVNRAEERGLEAVPPKWRKTRDGKGKVDSALPVRKFYIRAYEQAGKDIIALIESRISEILGDAQPNPILRTELREIIKRIKEEDETQ